MKRKLLCLLLVISVAVVAQQVADNNTNEGDEGQAQAEQPAETVEPGEEDSMESSDALEDSESGDGALMQIEIPADTVSNGENDVLDASGEAQPDDSDFKPDDEISEDYPVPLPSDI